MFKRTSMKKEVIIKYEDSRVLELLKTLSTYLGFTISEKEQYALKKPDRLEKESKAADFVNKWAGFLKKPDTDNSKYDYLTGKYK
jgi:hypothetical protein